MGRVRLFDATAEFLRVAGEQQPLVLVLDDLHAADPPSLLLLRFLARELGSTAFCCSAHIGRSTRFPESP